VKEETAVVDLTDDAASNKFVSVILAKYGTIDAAVLTAGGFAAGKLSETSTKEIKQQIELNFETAYNIARPVFLQMMKQGSGRIILIGSRQGIDIHQGRGAVGYAMSKSLLFRLAELMNAEAKGTDVVTTVVVPSTIDTPPNRKGMPDADYSKWVKAEAIADVIYFQCTEEATVIRESVIKVYGKA